MDAWIFRPGYPLVSVEVDGTGVKLSQRRFTYLGAEGNPDERWRVPIALRASVKGGWVDKRLLLGGNDVNGDASCAQGRSDFESDEAGAHDGRSAARRRIAPHWVKEEDGRRSDCRKCCGGRDERKARRPVAERVGTVVVLHRAPSLVEEVAHNDGRRAARCPRGHRPIAIPADCTRGRRASTHRGADVSRRRGGWRLRCRARRGRPPTPRGRVRRAPGLEDAWS
jgi:hypothetical protein